ncbi:phosphomethylpyrimidine kinase [Thermincola ferriacetica]|uniref:Thiamine-phosphate synthase n=1 Tax=Thermincola ferriacetica TaxID=281456 RepID=A0A0L6W3B0_9FIRM|nr:phosphomethylpyrimidine kinase [Thermincola ferriacetica]
MKKVLTIAGSDSGGGAGIQADLKTFSAFGVYGMSVITAVTSQNTLGVSGFRAMPAEFVGQQMSDVLSDIGADATKTGMLANADIICEVAEKIREFKHENLVVDPVMVATSGDRLMEPEAEKALKDKLLPLALVVTPNIAEAEVLSGIRIANREDVEKAAQIIYGWGPKGVIIKGGHLSGEAIDYYYDGKEIYEYRSPRVDTKNTHGTGCTFSAALAACLALGMPLKKAIPIAKDYLYLALLNADSLGAGHGPTNHLAGYFDHSTKAIRPAKGLPAAKTENNSRKLTGRKLYVITGQEFAKGRPVTEVVSQALAGGAGIIQLREKKWTTRQLVEVGRELQRLARENNALFIVNDRIDVALAVDADGVHLGQDDMPVRMARRVIGPDMILGISAETVEEALTAEKEGADYIGFGPVFHTDTKPDAGTARGLELLAQVKKAVSIPVYGIGGIKLDNAAEVLSAGADGVAVITAVVGADDITLAAQKFIHIMEGGR